MKLAYVKLCGFRGYRKPVMVEFAPTFTIIDGRNGAGKSTLCDAVEFALTGTIAKYQDGKASGESVANYIWWTGEAPADEHYVEVGFQSADGEPILIRRTQFGEPDAATLGALEAQLCDGAAAPRGSLAQLCRSSIIRDELIAALSLDLSETERYALLRDAIGATNADAEIDRGSRLAAAAKKRVAAAQEDVNATNRDLALAGRRVDDARAAAVEGDAVRTATERLRGLVGSTLAPDQLADPARARIAERQGELEELSLIIRDWPSAEEKRKRIAGLADAHMAARIQKESAESELEEARQDQGFDSHADLLATQARELTELVAAGRRLGLQDGKCPLCGSAHSQETFGAGLAAAEGLARRLDAEAFAEAKAEQEREEKRRKAAAAVAEATDHLVKIDRERAELSIWLDAFDRRRHRVSVASDASLESVTTRYHTLSVALDQAQAALRVLETLKLSTGLEKALSAETEVMRRLARAEERLGRARRGEAVAKALHDAARRAAAEILDRRLDRVLPLLSELYQRLQPHPLWRDIEYSIRGDVRRFLKLQVGDSLNPQFIFSSGQRRATGLAFLLSINLSLAWSRWRTILLDDPVQHVDDFRTLHVAEVMAQLCASGRQVVCAVEDAALADLLCRRLPVDRVGDGKRVSLGSDGDGALAVIREKQLAPFLRTVFLGGPDDARGSKSVAS